MEILYSNLRGIKIPHLSLEIITNTVSLIIVIIWSIKHYSDYNEIDTQKREEGHEYQIIQRMEDDDNFSIHFVLAVLVGFQFLRLILAFRLNRNFGPMAKTIAFMIYDILKFLFLFFTIFVFFLAAGMLIFTELSQYSNFDDAFNVLFAASLANYDYTIYDSMTDVSPVFGHIFINVFIIVSAILLLNFLIAILSTTYSDMQELKKAMYVKEVILHLQKHEYDQYYSSLISSLVPFNLIYAFFAPLVIT